MGGILLIFIVCTNASTVAPRARKLNVSLDRGGEKHGYRRDNVGSRYDVAMGVGSSLVRGFVFPGDIRTFSMRFDSLKRYVKDLTGTFQEYFDMWKKKVENDEMMIGYRRCHEQAVLRQFKARQKTRNLEPRSEERSFFWASPQS